MAAIKSVVKTSKAQVALFFNNNYYSIFLVGRGFHASRKLWTGILSVGVYRIEIFQGSWARVQGGENNETRYFWTSFGTKRWVSSTIAWWSSAGHQTTVLNRSGNVYEVNDTLCLPPVLFLNGGAVQRRRFKNRTQTSCCAEKVRIFANYVRTTDLETRTKEPGNRSGQKNATCNWLRKWKQCGVSATLLTSSEDFNANNGSSDVLVYHLHFKAGFKCGL